MKPLTLRTDEDDDGGDDDGDDDDEGGALGLWLTSSAESLLSRRLQPQMDAASYRSGDTLTVMIHRIEAPKDLFNDKKKSNQPISPQLNEGSLFWDRDPTRLAWSGSDGTGDLASGLQRLALGSGSILTHVVSGKAASSLPPVLPSSRPPSSRPPFLRTSSSQSSPRLFHSGSHSARRALEKTRNMNLEALPGVFPASSELNLSESFVIPPPRVRSLLGRR
ncbi:unnamed protein product [Pleuronectes platessa]|uniref:Uncharacterized protein n=1 Tax=Pleuronectes platessa TaxID=8262 RepID=A0A9N7USL9_PLEPL|nr:unnamed protein product [Pleuronectes platessa]